MTPRQARRILKDLQTRIEEERNGKPIPGEILERMTKPKVKQPLFQVFCEIRGGRVIPISPALEKEGADAVLQGFIKAMTMGKQPDAANPHMVPVF